MKRLLATLALWSILCAAAPLPGRLTPAQPMLGVPLLLTIDLQDETTELDGLPSLAPFELLEPPRREGSQLRILLLPMRPGDQRIPALPLNQGPSGQVEAAEIPVRVEEGFPADAEAAPLKMLPAKGRWPVFLWTAILPATLAIALLSIRLRRRGRKLISPPLESLQGEELLAELQRRLAADTTLDIGQRQLLAERLCSLRFSPMPPSEASIRQLLEDFLSITEGTA